VLYKIAGGLLIAPLELHGSNKAAAARLTSVLKSSALRVRPQGGRVLLSGGAHFDVFDARRGLGYGLAVFEQTFYVELDGLLD